MKSTRKDKSPKENSYPCLMEGVNSGSIYLMSSKEGGTIVCLGTSRTYPIGTKRNNLYHLKPFDGVIILEN